jgi:hypothetical protein
VEDPVPGARASLRRSAAIYAALLAADIAVVVYILIVRTGGAAFVTLSFVVVVGLLLAYQVVQHVRDFGARLAETDGVVMRKWKRADLIIAWDSFYLTVERTVFRVRPEDWIHVEEGEFVKVVHFPHTLTVVSVHIAPRGDRLPAEL